MNTTSLTTYLTDHLAGSVAAIQMLDHLMAVYGKRPEAVQIRTLKTEVEYDQQLLRDLMDRFEAKESPLKKAGAWIAEKALELKVNTSPDDFDILQTLEALVLGIEGKLRLWRSLQCVETGLDLPHLQSDAHRQIHQVELLRLEAAERAFGASPSR
ncbi:hypothetical protein WJU23_18635 [Prosthecobacter sp. SYSU 5D2]|uniref:hypothetical protein n=1 Tax=Prosthecobacter sp. SYSU 5D2 TaxID=3134134 RepID=UPI0031FF434E